MFYIFHGNDTLSQKEQLAELTAKLDDPSMLELNTTRFGGAISFAELRQVCDSIPFLSKRRLVICNDVLADSGRDLVDRLVDYLPHLPDTTRLFFLESKSLRRNHRLLKLAEQLDNGYIRAFDRPEGRALERWVQRVAVGDTVGLVGNTGNDLTLLANEVEKLVLYRAGDGEINADDVARLCPYVAETSIFELVDALGSRDRRKAATLLQQKLDEGADPFYLFAMIVRQFRLLIQIKELAEAGQRPPAIARSLGIHSFVAGKLYQQSQRFNLSQLEQIYSHLLETDVGVKTGRADMVTSLNLLVAALAV